MRKPLRILHLEDSPSDATLIREAIRRDGLSCEHTLARDRNEYEKALNKGHYDIILADYRLPGFDALQALQMVRAKNPDIPFILISGAMDEEVAIESLKEGATDCVMKSRLDRVGKVIRRAVAEAEAKTEQRLLQDQTARISRALRVLSECNKTLIRATDENALLKHICSVLVHTGRYAAAWVVMAASPEEDKCRLTAHAGCTPEQAAQLESLVTDADGRRRLTDTALLTGHAYISRDTPDSPSAQPWRRLIAEWKLASAMDLPLNSGGRAVGSLTIASSAPTAFVEEEGALLRELADDLIFGVQVIRTREERLQMLESLRLERDKLEAVTGSTDAGLCIITPDYRIAWLNGIMKAIFGQAEGTFCYETINHRSTPCTCCSARKILAGEVERATHEEMRHDVPGPPTWMQVIATPLRDRKRNIIGVLELAVPITEQKNTQEALQKSEERLTSLVETTSDMVWEVDAQGRYVYVSRKVRDVLGYEPAEMIGRTIFSLVPEKEAGRIGALFKGIVGSQRPFKFLINVNLHKDGHEVVLETSGVPLFDSEGTLTGYRGADRDISRRASAELALKSSHDRLLEQQKTLASLTRDEFFTDSHLGNKVRRLLETDAKQMGIARASLWRFTEDRSAIRCVDLYESKENRHSSGMELKATDYPAYFSALKQEEAIIANNACSHPYTREFADGYLVPLGITSMLDVPLILKGRLEGVLCHEHVGPAISWSAEQRLFAVSMAHLIALAVEQDERNRTQAALEQSEQRFRAIYNGSNDAVMILDDNGFIDCNPRAVELFGLHDKEELLRHRPDEFSPPTQPDGRPSREAAVEHNLKALATGSNRFEWLHVRPNGEPFTVEVSLAVLEYGGKRILQSTVRDITERKWAEEEIRLSYSRLRRTLEETAGALAFALEKRDPYTAGHQRRVARLAEGVARELDLSEDSIAGIVMAGVLHDVGKIAIPAEILSKPGKLRPLEFSIVKQHAEVGYAILKDIEFPWPVAEAVYQHHERINGSGYPRGMKGDDTLLEAKILAVADVVEAMASHRPYRAAPGVDLALKEISEQKGRLYDPLVADACLKLFREKRFSFDADSKT